MGAFFLIGTLLVLSGTMVIWYWRRRFLYRSSRNVPGPKALPLIGNIIDFSGGPNEIFDQTTKYFNSYPNLGKIWFGPILVYGVSKPEYLEKILTSQKAFSKGPFYKKFGQPLLGQGLMTAPVLVWKRHRKIIMPAFNQKTLNSFVEIFGRQCGTLSVYLENYVGKDFDLYEIISKCALDITCETFMGVQIETQKGELALLQSLDRLLEIVFLRIYKIWYYFDFIFAWTHLHKEDQELKSRFNHFTEKLIIEKQRLGGTTSTKRKAVVDLLIDSDKLTVGEIRDEIKTFLLAASDTTTTTACFTLLMLAMHPQAQSRVYDEVLQILGTDRILEYHDLPSLEYTTRVIKETLRLFPPGPLLTRYIEEDLALEDNLVLPKGASVILNVMHVQRNGEFWSEPLKFEPDRFLPEQVGNIYPYTYLPFAAGPRYCIGKRYAMMSLTTMIATLVRKFEFCTEYKTVEEVKLKTNLVVRPRDGFKISLELRKQESL